MNGNAIQELVEAISADPRLLDRLSKGVGDLLQKDAFTQGVNGQQVVWYNLNPTIMFLYPYLEQVPLIAGNAERGIAPIARVQSKGGAAAHWKTITSIDPDSVAGGVGRGQRAGAMRMNSNDLFSPFYGMGVEVPVDFETRYEAGQLTPEPLAIASQSGLRALMIKQEKMVIGGNSSLALGISPTPTVTDGASSGGTMSQGGGTLSVICVALTNDGYLRAVPNNPVTSATVVPGRIVRQNLDGSSIAFGGGSAQPSANATLSLTASHTALASVAPVSGAVAYAWFWGGVGTETLGAITTIAGIELKANPTGVQLASSLTADNSKDGLIPDGLITQMTGSTFGAVSNSYVKYTGNGVGAGGGAGTIGGGNGLTGDNAGGIVEFDALFKDRWENFRLGFKGGYILMNSQEIANITKKILQQAAGSTSLFRTSLEYNAQNIVVGRRITAYHNKYTNEDVSIEVHPWVPAGTVMFASSRVPYPMANVTNLLEFEERQGFYQIDWPLSTRQYQSGFYWDGAFKNHFTPAFGMISNLGNN
ncbi:MAG TPA: hypothetical protein VKS22_13275 [Candidatus Binataceae bacterium]|nr:hypothetical protein [Candidatus Binataceae bacterium]